MIIIIIFYWFSFNIENYNERYIYNFCNDTNYDIIKNGSNETQYESQIVYKINDNEYIKFTGGFYKSNTTISQITDDLNIVTIYTKQANNSGTEYKNYTTNIIFINNDTLKEKTYYVRHYPDLKKEYTNMTIEVNFNHITKHLLIQRILNNYYILTGIVFILIGIILCFFGFYQNIIKVVVSIIFGELITFMILEIFIGIHKIYFEYLFIFIGLVIGAIISFFCIKYINFYKIIISLTSGIISGIYLIDIMLIISFPLLIFSIMIDTIIIASISYMMMIKVLKKNYYIFFNSIIGGYILIRGISILLFKTLRFTELQLIIYFMNKFEWESLESIKEKEKETEFFWIYDILIASFIIISMGFYYYHTDYYRKSTMQIDSEYDDDDKEDEKWENEKE